MGIPRIFLFLLTALVSLSVAPAFGAEGVPTAPTPGMVTMVDLGAHQCIPCKMMAPIIEELKKEYAGRASILFIDVWENPGQAERFGISAIPTQIFYDKDGKEMSRHVGYLSKENIVDTMEKLGVPREAGRAQ